MSRLYLFVSFVEPIWIQCACCGRCSFSLQIELVDRLKKGNYFRFHYIMNNWICPNSYQFNGVCCNAFCTWFTRALVFYNHTCTLLFLTAHNMQNVIALWFLKHAIGLWLKLETIPHAHCLSCCPWNLKSCYCSVPCVSWTTTTTITMIKPYPTKTISNPWDKA